MADAITILGAIRSSQQVLWDFFRLIQRHRRLPERVADLALNLDACQGALSVWKKKWGIAEYQTGAFPLLSA